MWIFKYLVCLVKDHNWIGSRYCYCLRCGKLELAPEFDAAVADGEGELAIVE